MYGKVGTAQAAGPHHEVIRGARIVIRPFHIAEHRTAKQGHIRNQRRNRKEHGREKDIGPISSWQADDEHPVRLRHLSRRAVHRAARYRGGE